MDAPARSPATQEELLLLALDSGTCVVGEVLLEADFTLRHQDDHGRDDLEMITDLAAIRKIAKYDHTGEFRPLRSSPGLRGGWVIRAGSPGRVLLALEEIYPAAVGLWLSFIHGTVRPTDFRETLDRQSGMYRRAGLLRDDQMPSVIEGRCRKGCLRIPLWHPAYSPDPCIPGRMPLLCREACNLLVTDALDVARRNLPEENRQVP